MRLFRKKERINVYCQSCGSDLTSSGGMINQDKAIVCQSVSGPIINCSERYSFNSSGEIFFGEYYTPNQVQRKIRQGRLVKYGSLEVDASEQ